MSSANHKPLIRTLRTRLTVLHGATLAVTFTVLAILSYAVLSRTLYRHHDDELAQQASDLASKLDGQALTPVAIQSLAGTTIGSRFLMVRDHHGELLYRDPIFASLEPSLGQHAALIHAAAAGSRTPEFFTVTLERSGDVRFICVPVGAATAYVQIGDPVGDVRATLHAIAQAGLPLIPVVLLLSSAGGWLLATRALRPMRAITATLGEIHATDLSRRVAVDSRDREVSDLATTLNHLLDRLQRGFDTLRQFAGDVSHQIKTPLTVMKGSLEAAQRRNQPPADEALLQQLSDEITTISANACRSATVALADAPVSPSGVVDLSLVAADAADIVGALAELKNIEVRSAIQPGVMVQGDGGRLKQVLLNLGDNAVKYTPAGGRVSLEVRVGPQAAIVSVTDSGIGIQPEHLSRVFDRLFRAHAADRSSAGAGLGLAIAKRIVEAHHGTIGVTSAPNQGATFTIQLPIAPRSSRGAH